MVAGAVMKEEGCIRDQLDVDKLLPSTVVGICRLSHTHIVLTLSATGTRARFLWTSSLLSARPM